MVAASVLLGETVDGLVVGDGPALLVADVLEDELQAPVADGLLPPLLAVAHGAHLVVVARGFCDGVDDARVVLRE